MEQFQKRPLTGQLVSSKTKSDKQQFEGHIYLTEDINITIQGRIVEHDGDTFMGLTGYLVNYKNKNITLELTSGYLKSNKCFIVGTQRRTHEGSISIGSAKFSLHVWKIQGTQGKPNWFNIAVNKNRSFDESMLELLSKYNTVDDSDIEVDLDFDIRDDIELDDEDSFEICLDEDDDPVVESIIDCDSNFFDEEQSTNLIHFPKRTITKSYDFEDYSSSTFYGGIQCTM
jgi:hypothetical protein